MQETFGVIMLALVDGRPKVLNLKEILDEFIKHRKVIIVRRTKFDLEKAQDRAHILEGYKIALDNIDAVNKEMVGAFFKLQKHRSRTAKIARRDLGDSGFLRRDALDQAGKLLKQRYGLVGIFIHPVRDRWTHAPVLSGVLRTEPFIIRFAPFSGSASPACRQAGVSNGVY